MDGGEGSLLVADQRIRLDASPHERAAQHGAAATAGRAVRAADLSRIAHDPAAFEDFYRRNITAITRFMARRVADPHAVADLTADVFLAAIRGAHTYRPDRGTEPA